MFLFLVEFAFANYYYPVTERGAIHGSSFGWETSKPQKIHFHCTVENQEGKKDLLVVFMCSIVVRMQSQVGQQQKAQEQQIITKRLKQHGNGMEQKRFQKESTVENQMILIFNKQERAAIP
jgi:hypothetical protein